MVGEDQSGSAKFQVSISFNCHEVNPREGLRVDPATSSVK